MTRALTVGGICAGYGGLEMAAGLALGPTETAWHAEIDPDAAAVLATRYPGVPNHKDITAIDWRKVEPVDVLCAGFPCTTVSAAGKQLGDADPRWLWNYVITAARDLRPPTVVIENVANLVSIQGGRLFRTVLDDLRAAGYAVRWAIAGACMVGGSHHRHRVFILARRTTGTPPPAIRVDMPTCINHAASMLPTPRARDWKRGGKDGLEEALLLPTPNAALGRGTGTPSAETAAERMAAGRRFLDDAVALLPVPRATDGNTRGLSAVQPERWGKYAAAVARWATVFGALPPEPTEPNTKGGRRLAAPFPEWMMGLAPGWVTDLVDRNAALRLIGNGVFPLQGGRILGALAADEEAPTDLFGALAAAQ